MTGLADDVRRIAREHGADAVGIADARPFDRARTVLGERKAAGLHGGMHFTYGNPGRATDPQRTLAGARSLVVAARSYRRALPAAGQPSDATPAGPTSATSATSAAARPPVDRGPVANAVPTQPARLSTSPLSRLPEPPRSPAQPTSTQTATYALATRTPAPAADIPRPPLGEVASYSWRDHYAPLREALAAVADRLRAEGYRARVLVDDNALVDREAAYRAGIGWFGKNTNLLLPGRGSWFVLGSVVTDAPLPAEEQPQPDGCGSCTRCLPACPTGALVEPGVLDARRCLAWLLEAPGSFPVELRPALGGRIYGCDECQEVCPPNRAAERRDPPPPAEPDAEPWVSLVELLDLDDDTLLARFARWYVPRRQARYLRRNALVALGNVGDGADPEVKRVLRTALAQPDPIVQEHAEWAAVRLGRADLLSP